MSSTDMHTIRGALGGGFAVSERLRCVGLCVRSVKVFNLQ
jgi:hypothetical protein